MGPAPLAWGLTGAHSARSLQASHPRSSSPPVLSVRTSISALSLSSLVSFMVSLSLLLLALSSVLLSLSHL